MVIEQFPPLILFLLMFIIGASLSWRDLLKLREHKSTIVIATGGQIILLPAIAWIIVAVAEPSDTIANGIFLVSICPGGSISNVYSLLARANVALSVALTTLNSIVAIIVLPIILSTLYSSLISIDAEVSHLIFTQSIQLMIFLIVPVFLGALIRFKAPLFIDKVMPLLEKGSAVGLLILLYFIFEKYADQVREQLSTLVLLSIAFTLMACAVAAVLCRAMSLQRQESISVLIEFPVRNLALVATMAVGIFDNSEYLIFAAVFFATQIPLMFGTIARNRFVQVTRNRATG